MWAPRVLKVLYRNTQTMQPQGRRNEALQPVEPRTLPKGRSGSELLRKAVRDKDTSAADATLIALARGKPEEAIRKNDQAVACAAVHRYGQRGHAPRAVFDLLLKYAVSEDGALHAENWGYRTFKTPAALTEGYVQLVTALRPLIGRGLSAAVYTQTTDVEVEVNGLMTYDRAQVKMNAGKITAANRKLYLPPPVVQTVVPSSREKPQEWRYTTTRPAEGWQQAAFDDSAWKTGPGGFGTRGTPGAVVRTTWDTSDIWLRRTIELPAKGPLGLHWQLHHDEDVEVYLNGKLVLKRGGFVTAYVLAPLSEEALKALKPGRNTLAVHCHQTGGGQYIDVGLVSLREVTAK